MVEWLVKNLQSTNQLIFEDDPNTTIMQIGKNNFKILKMGAITRSLKYTFNWTIFLIKTLDLTILVTWDVQFKSCCLLKLYNHRVLFLIIL